LRGILVFPPRNPRPAGQEIHRLGEIQPLDPLHEADHIAVFTAGPATVALPVGIDIEGRAAIIVEGAQSFENPPGLTQGQITTDDIYDVVGGFDALDSILEHRTLPPGFPPPTRKVGV